MNLFSPDYILTLTPDEYAVVMRPIAGETGGAQSLLRQFHDTESATPQSFTCDEQMLDKSYQYAYDYGSGGFQDRFRAIVKAALRAGWQPS